MLEIILLIIIGVFAGVITGLTPGLHPNTVIFTSLPFYFYSDISFTIYASLISGISISHTFHDFIPSIFLGVPEPDSALAALPGQEMALRGKGAEAFLRTVYGGLYSMVFAIPISFLLYFLLEPAYSMIEPQMHLLLLFFMLLIVFKSNGVYSSIIVAVLSGLIGLLSFESAVNQQYVLIPVFGGLFAFPAIWNAISSSNSVPVQDRNFRMESPRVPGLLGFLAAIPVAIFPGTTSSVSTAFLWPILDRKKFLSAVGAANTADIFISFLTLMILEKARSGASVVIKTIGRTDSIGFLVASSVFAVSVAAPVSFLTLKFFLRHGLYSRQRILAVLAGTSLTVFTFFLTGVPGLIVLVSSSATGFFAAFTGNRHSCMAVLLVPSILFFAPAGFI